MTRSPWAAAGPWLASGCRPSGLMPEVSLALLFPVTLVLLQMAMGLDVIHAIFVAVIFEICYLAAIIPAMIWPKHGLLIFFSVFEIVFLAIVMEMLFHILLPSPKGDFGTTRISDRALFAAKSAVVALVPATIGMILRAATAALLRRGAGRSFMG